MPATVRYGRSGSLMLLAIGSPIIVSPIAFLPLAAFFACTVRRGGESPRALLRKRPPQHVQALRDRRLPVFLALELQRDVAVISRLAKNSGDARVVEVE